MRRLFVIQTILIAAVGAVHLAALKLYLYWLFPWLDIFVHFFGAMWVALAAVFLLAAAKVAPTVVRVAIVVVSVSIGWELFELWGGIPREANFALDTIIDLVMDVLGGVAGYFFAKYLIKSEKRHDIIRPHGSPQGNPS